jgi:hypothetical protein
MGATAAGFSLSYSGKKITGSGSAFSQARQLFEHFRETPNLRASIARHDQQGPGCKQTTTSQHINHDPMPIDQ